MPCMGVPLQGILHSYMRQRIRLCSSDFVYAGVTAHTDQRNLHYSKKFSYFMAQLRSQLHAG